MKLKWLAAMLIYFAFTAVTTPIGFADEAKENIKKLKSILKATQEDYPSVVKSSYEEVIRTHYVLTLSDHYAVATFLLESQKLELSQLEQVQKEWENLNQNPSHPAHVTEERLKTGMRFHLLLKESQRKLNQIKEDLRSLESSWNDRCSQAKLTSTLDQNDPETLFPPSYFGIVRGELPLTDIALNASISQHGVSGVSFEPSGKMWKTATIATGSGIGYGLSTGVWTSGTATSSVYGLSLSGAAVGSGVGLVICGIISFFENKAYVHSVRKQMRLLEEIQQAQKKATHDTIVNAKATITGLCSQVLAADLEEQTRESLEINDEITAQVSSYIDTLEKDLKAEESLYFKTLGDLETTYLASAKEGFMKALLVRQNQKDLFTKQVREFIETEISPRIAQIEMTPSFTDNLGNSQELWGKLILGDAKFARKSHSPPGVVNRENVWESFHSVIVRNMPELWKKSL